MPSNARQELDSIERRGRALRDFCRRVRERGDVAVTEEDDLVRLRLAWIVLHELTRGAP
jgi:hypothetical protein